MDVSTIKLGKAPARNDARDLRYRAVMPLAVTLPFAYDFDLKHPGIPTPMFRNDELGDCVMAGRAHQTLRFELLEQNKVIQITDKEVESEYFTETGGGDDGLVVADSLALWRSEGWTAAGRHYRAFAYARVDHTKTIEVQRAIYSHVGIGLGLQLPLSAQTQLRLKLPWTVTTGKGTRAGSWGGHYVYCCAYNATGPVCITWGKKQQMTWAWLARYGDEAFAIFDAKNAPAAVHAFIEKLPKRA